MRKIKMLILIVAAALTIPLGAAQRDSRAEAQLQAAITKETVEGDLKGAIEQYKKLANSSNRAVAARALIRMGECYEKLYEKLGDAEARKAYERVVRDFSDQKDALAAAQQHLAANSAQSEAGIEVQRVAAYTDKREYGGTRMRGQSISRDGRYLVFSKDDGIYVQDLAKDTERRIVPRTSPQESFDTAISPDGRQVVYGKTSGQDPWNSRGELCVIGADGSNPRLLFGGKQGEPLVLWAVSPDGRQVAYALFKAEGDGMWADFYVMDTDGSAPRRVYSGEKNELGPYILWSPDGKYLLMWKEKADPGGNSRLLLISVPGGSSRVIGPGTGYGQFSPDGRYISFYRWSDPSSRFQAGIYVVPTDGGKEVLLAAGAASNPRWTPDGKRIVFRDQRPDQSTTRTFPTFAQEPCDIYSIRVVDGKPEGKPELMKKDSVLPSGWFLGSAQNGDLYYSIVTNESANVYMVDLDPATGKAVSKPARLNQTLINSSAGPPRWSPDGLWLAYAKVMSGSPRTLMIRSATTAEEHELTVSPPWNSTGWCDPVQWFPDNRSLLALDQMNGRFAFRKVDIQSGQQQLFFAWPGNEALHSSAAFSPDGKILFFSLRKPDTGQSADLKTTALNTLRLMRRNMESGEEKELYQVKSPRISKGFEIALSSDGRQLAFTRWNTDDTTTLLAMPADGGDARELYRSNLLTGTRTWTKDGRHILVIQSDANTGMDQLWSVSAETGDREPVGLTFPIIGMASFHPDGRRLTYVGRQPGQRELWVMKLLPPGTKPSGK